MESDPRPGCQVSPDSTTCRSALRSRDFLIRPVNYIIPAVFFTEGWPEQRPAAGGRPDHGWIGAVGLGD